MASVYVDPTNGDDGTGTGTSGNPYASISGAISSGTFDTTNGNTIRLADTSKDTLSSTIDVSTVSGVENPLVIEGWDNGGSLTLTGPFGDTISGIGEIDGNDAVASIFSASINYVTLRKLKIHSTTGNVVSITGGQVLIEDCEIYNGGTSYTVNGADDFIVRSSYIHTDQTAGTVVYRPGHVVGSRLSGADKGAFVNEIGGLVRNSIIDGYVSVGLEMNNNFQQVYKCTLDGTDGDSTCHGIEIDDAAAEGMTIVDNIVANHTGASAEGISGPTGASPATLGNNAFYNNTTNESTETPARAIANVTESSDPFTNRATGDYSLVSGANSNGAALFTNLDVSNPDNIGAVQDYASGGGGGGGETTSVFMA